MASRFPRPFRDRVHAGRVLAQKLKHYADRPEVLALALPRGGVPVAFEVSTALHVPLDVFLVRKLGVPGHEELAMGAIASGGVRVLNDDVIGRLHLPQNEIDRAAAIEQRELERRERLYRGDRPSPDLKDRIVILIDDGLATGSTMRAPAQAVRQHHPARLVVAVPTAAVETCEEFRSEVDEVICALTPAPFHAVGLWYEEFSQTSDEEVRGLLARASTSRAFGRPMGTPMIRKLKSGEYRLYSRKANPKTGRRRNLGTFRSRRAAEAHERAVQFFKRRG